jgi:hypothetical protein
MQCCGYELWIRCFFDPGIQDGQKSRFAQDQIFGLKILAFLYLDADPGSCQPWIQETGLKKIRSGTLDLG